MGECNFPTLKCMCLGANSKSCPQVPPSLSCINSFTLFIAKNPTLLKFPLLDN